MTTSNEVAAWLRGEVDQVLASTKVGVNRRISHDDAMLAYRRAADELDALHSVLDDLRAKVESEPAMQNKEKYGDIGMRVNKALGR